MQIADGFRKHGFSQVPFHNFKSRYGGMEMSDVAKLLAVTDQTLSYARR